MNIWAEGENIFVETQGRTLRLHSSRPQAEAEKLTASISPQADALFLGGIGAGWLLEKALQLPRLKYIFAIEPSPQIASLAQTLHPRLALLKQDPRVLWIDSPENLSLRLRSCSFTNLALIVPRSYGELFPAEISLYQKIFSEVLSRKEISKNTLARFGKMWVKNFFRNMPRYLNSVRVNAFLGYGLGKPALIIGAGPSLDEALPFIKQAQHRALLIAADTALPMLEAHDISPDFVVSIDPQEINSYYLRYAHGRKHYLIADPGLHDSSFEGYMPQNTVLCDAVFPFYEGFRKNWGVYGSLASGGSVSTSAFDFARAIGCSPIILAGQDLAFSSRKSYSRGNILGEFGRAKCHRLAPLHNGQARTLHPPQGLYAQGRRGQPVLSDSRFTSFAGWFSEEISKTAAPVYTAGMDGALLKGAVHLEIPEAFALLTKNIDKSFSPAAENINSAPLIERLEALLKESASLQKSAQRAQACIGRKDIQGLFKYSTELQHRLASSPDCSRIVEIGIQDSVWKALNTENNCEEQRFHSTAALIKDIAESLHFLSKITKKTLLLLKTPRA